MTRGAAAFFVFVLLAAGWWAQPARAEYRACNETSYILEVAVATLSELGPVSRGWFVVAPGDCREILDAPLDGEQELFAYARAADLYGSEGIHFPGDAPFCIAAEDFLIEGVGLCRLRDFHHARFASIAFEGKKWTTYFSEERGYGQKRAAVAGWQRLLGRLGYAVGAVDGINGARTRLALQTFREEHGLGAEEGILFDAMSRALLSRREENGLEICNRSDYRIWAAVGVGKGELAEEGLAAVETRGWLPAESGDCVVVLEELLEGQEYYLFAEAVDTDGFAVRSDVRTTVWGGEHILCVSAIRFVIGRQGECDARNLDQRGFYRVETGGEARVVEVLK